MLKEIDLSIYNLKEIQNFVSILNQASQKNIDLSVLEQGLSSYVESIIIERKKENEKYHYTKVKAQRAISGQSRRKDIQMPKCPSCEKGYLEEVPNSEGLVILACRKCRFSQIVGETNGE